MRLLFTILGIISALIGLTLSIMPFEKIALIPIVLGFIFGLLALKATNSEGKGKSVIKLIFLALIIALGFAIYRTIFDENVVEKDDVETIEKEKERDQESLEELEDLKIDD